MTWKCATCSRHWGRCWKICPLCKEIFEKKLCLLKLAPGKLPFPARGRIGRFLGTNLTVLPLPKHSLCHEGTAFNCRCSRCRHVDPRIVIYLGRKTGRGRAVAARWVHLLARAVGASHIGSHNALDGLLLSRGYSHGNPHVFLKKVQKFLPRGKNGEIPYHAAFVWIMALCMQYTEDRPGLTSMIGRSVVASIDLAEELPWGRWARTI